MIKLASLLASSLLLLISSVSARAQDAAPATKILAIGSIVPGADMQKVRATLPLEVRATVQLYLQGKIDQWYSLKDRAGVAFILNESNPTAARQILEGLPLDQAHYMTFELIPIGPLSPLQQLLHTSKPDQ